MREDLIQSAVSFLTDPKVQSAPLAKKVSFLESKGMTSEEIEEAMSRANGKSTGVVPAGTPAGAVAAGAAPLVPAQAAGHAAAPVVPARPSYDWRDVFIAAVLAGGVGYGVWTLAKRVFGPWFKVPPEDELEKDKEALDAQYQAVEDAFKEIKSQTSEALSTVASQSDKVKNALDSLDAVLKDLKEGDVLREAEFKSVKGEIDALKEMVPKMMDRNKEEQNVILSDLQNELKSLKSLLMNRNRAAPSSPTPAPAPASTTTTTAPEQPSQPAQEQHTTDLSARLSAALNNSVAGGSSNGNRGGIPAWQMASKAASSTSTAATATTTDTASSSPALSSTETQASSSSPQA